jgi:hypothetical protein
MAAIFMLALLQPRADKALLCGHQQLIGLRELRRAQAIKRIVELDLIGETSVTSLSHAFVERSETLPAHV